jgi:hypothetical protein
MEVNQDSFFLISIISSLITISLAYARFVSKRIDEFRNLSEFLFSFLTMVTISYLSLSGNIFFIFLSMISWLWIFRGLILICQDILRENLNLKDHFLALGAGSLLTLVLYIIGQRMLIYTAPMAVSFGLVCLSILFQTYKKFPAKRFGLLEKAYKSSHTT